MKSKRIVPILTNLLLLFSFFLFLNPAGFAQDVPRIGVKEAHTKVSSGEALLICAYGDRRCYSLMIKGAILQSQLESRIESLPKSTELIFYCV